MSWSILHNEEFHNSSQLRIIGAVQSRESRRANHMAQKGETENAYRIFKQGEETTLKKQHFTGGAI